MENTGDLVYLKNMLCECLKNGIEENGTTRDFDIIDYYQYSKIPIEKLMKTMASAIQVSADERRLIQPFITKYSTQTLKSFEVFIEARMNEKMSIDGIEITSEMKIETISYFMENQIPLNFKNYITYLRRKVTSLKVEVQR